MHFFRWRGHRSRSVLTIALCAVVGACGLQQRAVERTRTSLTARYAAEFVCATSEAIESLDGFRVEGCGQVAFYHCDWSRDARVSGAQNPACPAGRAGCPSSVYVAAISPDCVLEHSRPMTEQEQLAAAKREKPKIEEAAENQRALDRHRTSGVERAAEFAVARNSLAARPGQLQPLGQVEADGVRIELASLSHNASFVLLRFITQRTLSPAPCHPTVVLDSQILPAETIDDCSAHEAAFLLKAADLQGLEHSQHFRGVVCGVEFALDEPARRKLAGAVAPP